MWHFCVRNKVSAFRCGFLIPVAQDLRRFCGEFCGEFAQDLRRFHLRRLFLLPETNWTFLSVMKHVSRFCVRNSTSQDLRKFQVIATNFNLSITLETYAVACQYTATYSLNASFFSNSVLWFFPCVVPDGSGIVTTFKFSVWHFFSSNSCWTILTSWRVLQYYRAFKSLKVSIVALVGIPAGTPEFRLECFFLYFNPDRTTIEMMWRVVIKSSLQGWTISPSRLRQFP